MKLQDLISEYKLKIKKYEQFTTHSHVVVIYENVVRDLEKLEELK